MNWIDWFANLGQGLAEVGLENKQANTPVNMYSCDRLK